MFESINNLIENSIEAIYQIDRNREFIFENLDLIQRCIERSDIVYESQRWFYFDRFKF